MRHVCVFVVATMVAISSTSVSAASFSYGAWIPYWKKTAAIPETIQHIDVVKEISPFSYEVQAKGNIRDAMKLKDVSWLTLMETAGSKNIKIIPTFSWQSGGEIHRVLSSSTARSAHIANILRLVDENDFDGIDIDYENKQAETNMYFSKFLTELSKEIHKRKKTLSCTIEARTPARSRFVTVPKKLEYANDFGVINRVCDEVRIMAYGQGRIDLKLNKKKSATSTPYSPIADAEWVEKVIGEALKTIRKEKIMLGVANFGYDYEIMTVNGTMRYNNARSLTYDDALTLANAAGATFTRTRAGEVGFMYATSTPTGTSSTHFVTLSDANAVKANIALAKKYKLKGVFLFKVDGESDPALWNVLK